MAAILARENELPEAPQAANQKTAVPANRSSPRLPRSAARTRFGELAALGVAAVVLATTSPTAPALAGEAAPQPLRFDERKVESPASLRFTTLDGREIRGRVTGWSDRGFVVSAGQRLVHKVPWSDLSAEEHARIRGGLLNSRGQTTAEDWLLLGERLLSRRKGEPEARAFAEEALDRATKLKPALGEEADRLLRDADADAAAAKPRADRAPTQPDTPSPLGVYPDAWTGSWDATVDPPEVAKRLRSAFAFGTARGDDPASFHNPLIMAERDPRSVTDRLPKTGTGLWRDWMGNRHNTTAHTLAAMDATLLRHPMQHAEPRLEPYVQVLVDGDPEMAVPLAEAHLRVCGNDDLPRALELLAAAYRRSDRDRELDALLRAGTAFRPDGETLPAEYRELGVFSDRDVEPRSDNPAPLIRSAWSALLRGDGRDAERWLSGLPGLKMTQQQEALRRQQHRGILRIARGLAASLDGRHATLEQLEQTFARLDEEHRSGTLRTPLAERLDPLPLPEVLAELQHAIHVYGRGSIPAADTLLYLVEQRGWSGLEFSANTIHNIAFYVDKYDGSARAVPLYVLVQKVGCTRHPRETDKIDYFAAAESGHLPPAGLRAP